MNKAYEIVITAHVNNEDDMEAWLKEHLKDTEKVRISQWGIDLQQEKFTINLKHPRNEDDMDDLLKAIKKSLNQRGVFVG